MPRPFEPLPGEISVFRRRPSVRSFQWAQDHLRIVSGPYRGQRWRGDLLPYARGIMDAWDSASVREILLIAPSQCGKTTIAYACLFADLDRRPGPAAIVMPDEDAVARIFETKLIAHIERSPRLRRMIARQRYASRRNSVLLRDGSKIDGMWAGSDSRMSSVSIEKLLIDEEDAYPKGAVNVVRERTTAYPHTRKIFRFSKVRGAEGEGTIYADMHRQAQVIYRYMAICPVCHAAQHMRFEQIRVGKDIRNPDEILGGRHARYECEHCGYHWTDHARDQALRAGYWEADREDPAPEIVGFRLRSWESPFVSLSEVMRDWFAAQDDPNKLRNFDNNHRSVPHRTIVTTTTEEQLLRLVRPDRPRGAVPEQAKALTLAVDMQKRDFWYSVWAHRPPMETGPREDWVIEYGQLPDWAALELLLYQGRWRQEGTGAEFGIWRAALDTGGSKNEDEAESRTQQAYMWLLQQGPGLVHGCKGMSRRDSRGRLVRWFDMVKMSNGRTLPGALRRYDIDGDSFKRILLLARLREDAREPIHFHADTSKEYVRTFLSEKLHRTRDGKEFWKRVLKSNHWLDCAVMHLAMTHFEWMPSLEMTVREWQAAEAASMDAAPQSSIAPHSSDPRANWFYSRR